jgi:hypothetical protein
MYVRKASNMQAATLMAKFHVLRTGRNRYARIPDKDSEPDHEPEPTIKAKTRADVGPLRLARTASSRFHALAKVIKPLEVEKPVAIQKSAEVKQTAAPNMLLVYAIFSRMKLSQAGYAVDVIPFVDFRHVDYGKLLTMIAADEDLWTFFVETLR